MRYAICDMHVCSARNLNYHVTILKIGNMDVYGLMDKLCSRSLEKALFEHHEDDMLKSFSRPSRW